MARFYASIQGNRGEASRMGTTGSGIAGHVRGWSAGVRVECRADCDDNDVVEVSITDGSNGSRGRACLEIRPSANGGPSVVTLDDTPEMVKAARELIQRHQARNRAEILEGTGVN